MPTSLPSPIPSHSAASFHGTIKAASLQPSPPIDQSRPKQRSTIRRSLHRASNMHSTQPGGLLTRPRCFGESEIAAAKTTPAVSASAFPQKRSFLPVDLRSAKPHSPSPLPMQSSAGSSDTPVGGGRRGRRPLSTPGCGVGKEIREISILVLRYPKRTRDETKKQVEPNEKRKKRKKAKKSTALSRRNGPTTIPLCPPSPFWLCFQVEFLPAPTKCAGCRVGDRRRWIQSVVGVEESARTRAKAPPTPGRGRRRRLPFNSFLPKAAAQVGVEKEKKPPDSRPLLAGGTVKRRSHPSVSREKPERKKTPGRRNRKTN